MDIRRKVINLYAVPAELIPEGAQIVPSACSLPTGVIPQVICRADGAVSAKVASLFVWFQKNLREENGYIVGSSALPALSLDKGIWKDAIGLLKTLLEKYEKVQGPVFLPSFDCGRTGKFAIADLYTKLLHGSITIPVVTYKVGKKWEAEPEAEDKAQDDEENVNCVSQS